MIHKTAIIDPKAKIASNVKIGAYSIYDAREQQGFNRILSSVLIAF